MAFHGRLLYTWQQPPGTGMRMSGNLLNGITSRKRRVTSDDAANPRATLTYGLTAPVAARPRFPEGRDHMPSTEPAVSGVTNRDPIAWAADHPPEPTAPRHDRAAAPLPA